MANARHHDRQSHPGVHRLVRRVSARRAPAGGRIQSDDNAALLARGVAGARRRHAENGAYVPGAALRHASRGDLLDAVAAHPGARLVLCGAGSDNVLRGAGAARLSRRPRGRQFLVVHALDELVFPQAAAGDGARDPGRRRKLRRLGRPVRNALDHRVCHRRIAAWESRRLSPRPGAAAIRSGCRTRPQSTCRSSSYSALPRGGCSRAFRCAPISASSSTSSKRSTAST